MKSLALRLLIAVAGGFGAAIAAAVAIALVDLYLVGHGHAGLLRESISWAAAGVHLSIGDVVMLALAFLGAVTGWKIAGKAV